MGTYRCGTVPDFDRLPQLSLSGTHALIQLLIGWLDANRESHVTTPNAACQPTIWTCQGRSTHASCRYEAQARSIDPCLGALLLWGLQNGEEHPCGDLKELKTHPIDLGKHTVVGRFEFIFRKW